MPSCAPARLTTRTGAVFVAGEVPSGAYRLVLRRTGMMAVPVGEANCTDFVLRLAVVPLSERDAHSESVLVDRECFNMAVRSVVCAQLRARAGDVVIDAIVVQTPASFDSIEYLGRRGAMQLHSTRMRLPRFHFSYKHSVSFTLRRSSVVRVRVSHPSLDADVLLFNGTRSASLLGGDLLAAGNSMSGDEGIFYVFSCPPSTTSSAPDGEHDLCAGGAAQAFDLELRFYNWDDVQVSGCMAFSLEVDIEPATQARSRMAQVCGLGGADHVVQLPAVLRTSADASSVVEARGSYALQETLGAQPRWMATQFRVESPTLLTVDLQFDPLLNGVAARIVSVRSASAAASGFEDEQVVSTSSDWPGAQRIVARRLLPGTTYALVIVEAAEVKTADWLHCTTFEAVVRYVRDEQALVNARGCVPLPAVLTPPGGVAPDGRVDVFGRFCVGGVFPTRTLVEASPSVAVNRSLVVRASALEDAGDADLALQQYDRGAGGWRTASVASCVSGFDVVALETTWTSGDDRWSVAVLGPVLVRATSVWLSVSVVGERAAGADGNCSAMHPVDLSADRNLLQPPASGGSASLVLRGSLSFDLVELDTSASPLGRLEPTDGVACSVLGRRFVELARWSLDLSGAAEPTAFRAEVAQRVGRADVQVWIRSHDMLGSLLHGRRFGARQLVAEVLAPGRYNVSLVQAGVLREDARAMSVCAQVGLRASYGPDGDGSPVSPCNSFVQPFDVRTRGAAGLGVRGQPSYWGADPAQVTVGTVLFNSLAQLPSARGGVAQTVRVCLHVCVCV